MDMGSNIICKMKVHICIANEPLTYLLLYVLADLLSTLDVTSVFIGNGSTCQPQMQFSRFVGEFRIYVVQPDGARLYGCWLYSFLLHIVLGYTSLESPLVES